MSFLGLDISLLDIIIIVNALAVLFTFIVSIQISLAMRQQNKKQFALQVKENQRRKHESSQHLPQNYGDGKPLILRLPVEKANELAIESTKENTFKKQEFLSGNDIRVVSKKHLSTVQKISENVGET